MINNIYFRVLLEKIIDCNTHSSSTVNEVIEDAIILGCKENGEGFVDMQSKDIRKLISSFEEVPFLEESQQLSDNSNSKNQQSNFFLP